MRKLKLYAPFLLGIVLLLVIAFFLPQMIFQIQDGYHFADKAVENWEHSNNALVSAGYERDMHQRMANLLSKETEDLTISAISYGGKNVDDVVELLERVFASEWMGNINNMTMGIYFDFLQETSTISIQDCKKYVVYENTSLESILLMAWYLDIYMVDYDSRVQLIVDAETESVYQIKITGMGDSQDIYEANKKRIKVDKWEYYEATKYEMYSIAPYCMSYFNSYYEAGMEDFKAFDEIGWNSDEAWYATRDEEEDYYHLSFYMPYGNLNTEFEVYILEGNGGLPDYSAGITLIRNFVPEMIQD